MAHVSQIYGPPLYCAADNGHEEIIRVLLKAGADPNAVSSSGETPLCAAAFEGHAEIVRLLVEGGADVNLSGKDHHSPLYNACMAHQAQAAGISRGGDVGEIISYLLAAGAQVDQSSALYVKRFLETASSASQGIGGSNDTLTAPDCQRDIDLATAYIADAEAELKEIESIADWRVSVSKATQLIKEGALAKADVALQRAQAAGADTTKLRSNLEFTKGMVYMMRARIEERVAHRGKDTALLAIEAFKASAELDPDPAAYHNMGVLYEFCGDKQQAIDAYQQVISLSRDPELITAINKKLRQLL